MFISKSEAPQLVKFGLSCMSTKVLQKTTFHQQGADKVLLLPLPALAEPQGDRALWVGNISGDIGLGIGRS